MGFINKSNGLSDELPRYGVVIVLSFLADFGALFLFKKYFDWSLTVSVLGSYALGVYVNYVLSSRWVFGTRRFKNNYHEPLYFWLIAAGGAVLSLAAIHLLDSFGFGLGVAKILAEGSVAVLSFSGKKILLFSDLDAYTRVRRLYQTAPFGDRLHALIRYITVPYARIKSYIPKGTESMLEIGTGHGLLAHLLAVDCKIKRVVGVDIDSKKITIAQGITDAVHFTHAVPKKETFDVVLIADVLYLLDKDAKKTMIAQALHSCSKGGVVLIKEMSFTPRWKYILNQLQETVSVKLLKITDFKNKPTLVLVDLQEISTTLSAQGHTCTIHRLDQGYLHPHSMLVITKGAE